MSDSPLRDEAPDPSADTGQFRAFVDGQPDRPARKVGVAFRLLTLVGGLAVLAVLVGLLFLL